MNPTLPSRESHAQTTPARCENENCVKSCIMSIISSSLWDHWAMPMQNWSARIAYIYNIQYMRETGRKLMAANKLTTLPPEWPSIKGMGEYINLKNRTPFFDTPHTKKRECSLARCNSSELFFSSAYMHLSAMRHRDAILCL
jgi:hypothetical protein